MKMFFFQKVSWLNSLFDRNAPPSDYAISFSASAIDNLIFFFITGLLVLGISMRRPEDGDFETKISYLFPILNTTSSAKSYAMSEINKIACISSKSETNLILESYNKETEVFKVRGEYQCHLANLHNNYTYNDDLSFQIRVDDIKSAEVGGVFGCLEKINFIDGMSSDESHSKVDSPIHMNEPLFKHPVTIEIEPNGKAIYSSTHWTWNKFKSPSTVHVGRFTEKFIYRITNSTGVDLELYEPFESDDPIILKDQASHVINKTEFTPRDSISYRINIKQ